MKNLTSIRKFTTLFPTLNQKILLFPHDNYLIPAPNQKNRFKKTESKTKERKVLT